MGRDGPRNDVKMHWTTINTYVDHETGEVLTKKHIEQGIYVPVKKTTTTKQTQHYGTKFTTIECIRNPQGTIKF